MIVTLQTERVRTLEQVRAFVEGSEAVDFTGADRESVYEFVRRTLVRLSYERLGKPDKGLVRCNLAKVTGLSLGKTQAGEFPPKPVTLPTARRPRNRPGQRHERRRLRHTHRRPRPRSGRH